MENLKNLQKLEAFKASLDRKRAGVLYKRLLESYHENKLSLIFNEKGKITGFYSFDRLKKKPIKHKLFIRQDKLMFTCKEFGKKAWEMDIYVPNINREDD